MLLFLVVKLFLDFFTSYREPAFVITNAFLFSLISYYFYCFKKLVIARKHLIEVALVFIFIFIQLIQNADIIMLLKLVSFYLNFRILTKIFSTLTELQIQYIAKRFILITVAIFVLVFAFSVATGKISSRQIGYFEHVNLLGNVIVFLVLGVIYFNFSLPYKLAVFLMGVLSMSTGSMLLSMLVFLPVRKITLKNTLIYLTLLFVVIVLFYFLSQAISPKIHGKIFGIFSFFDTLTFEEFRAYVKSGVSLKIINSDVESSFVWRIYAWVKYHFALLNSSFINLIIGHGALGFLTVWDGVMPHNDYILILYDLGIVFYLLLLPAFYKFYIISKSNKVILFIGLLFLVRLSIENVIYSYYTFSIFIVQLALIKSHYDKAKPVHNSDVSVK